MCRALASLAANKLLVMQDGRSLYSPLFSGGFWDAHNTFLEDVDRIEVIRGPGAAMWGANAVNSVIHITSKEAREMQGTLVQGGGGTELRAFGGARYGGKLGEQTYYRVYGQHWNRGVMALADGFRLDSYAQGENHLTFQGELLYSDFGLINQGTAVNRDANLLGRWTHQFASESELQVQTFYSRFFRNVPGQFGETRDT